MDSDRDLKKILMNDINPNGRPNLGRLVLGSQSLIRVIFCSVLFHLGGKSTKGWPRAVSTKSCDEA